MHIDLSIIIVSWNVRELLLRCLTSIARDLTPRPPRKLERCGQATLSCKERGKFSCEVFVVDNASTDGTAEFLRNFQFPTAVGGAPQHAVAISNFQFIANERNLGFAAANNQGIREAKGKYILLLNPDTEFIASRRGDGERGNTSRSPHAGGSLRMEGQDPKPLLRTMLHFMKSHPRCGILGPRLLNRGGTLQRSVRRFPDTWSPLLSSIGITPRRYLATDFDYTKAQQVDQVMGACFLIRRELMDAIGMLDENFFIWFEEVDYCKRAKEAGWEVWYTPDASVTHYGGESFGQVVTLKKQWMFTRSLLYYFWKHRQYGACVLHAVAIPFRFIFSIIFEIASPRSQ